MRIAADGNLVDAASLSADDHADPTHCANSTHSADTSSRAGTTDLSRTDPGVADHIER
jgi:hypothetical protein